MSNKDRLEKYNQLCDAIKKKDKVTARQLLLNNADVNSNYKSSHSLLHLAIIEFEDTEIMEMLLEKKADIFAKNYHRQTPLELAAQSNKAAAFELIINKGAQLNYDNLNKLMNIATKNGYIKIVRILVNWATKNCITVDREISFDLAVKKGHPQIVKYFLPYLQFEKPSDKFILEDAVLNSSERYKDCIDILLQHGFTVSPNSSKNHNFVFSAVKNGYIKIVEKLLKFEIDVNMRNLTTGLTLLHIACLNDHLEIVELLIKHKADMDILITKGRKSNLTQFLGTENLSGRTALYIAMVKSNVKLIELLLDNGAILYTNLDFLSMASLAIQKENMKVLKILLKHKNNVNSVNDNKETLLHLCTRVNDGSDGQASIKHEMIELLLKKGADPNVKNEDGQTPLHILCEDSQTLILDIIKLLLKHNADIDAEDTKGKTPLFYACSETRNAQNISLKKVDFDSMNKYAARCKMSTHGVDFMSRWKNFDSAKLLLANNADVHVFDQEGLTLLHLVAERNKLELTEYFIKMGIDVNSVDEQGRTPMHLAAGNGCAKVVESLLRYGADVNILTNDRQPALEYAFDGFNRLQNNNKDDCGNSNLYLFKSMDVDNNDENRNDGDYISKINSYMETIKILKEHILELQFNKFTIIKQNSDLLYHDIIINLDDDEGFESDD